MRLLDFVLGLAPLMLTGAFVSQTHEGSLRFYTLALPLDWSYISQTYGGLFWMLYPLDSGVLFHKSFCLTCGEKKNNKIISQHFLTSVSSWKHVYGSHHLGHVA